MFFTVGFTVFLPCFYRVALTLFSNVQQFFFSLSQGTAAATAAKTAAGLPPGAAVPPADVSVVNDRCEALFQ